MKKDLKNKMISRLRVIHSEAEPVESALLPIGATQIKPNNLQSNVSNLRPLPDPDEDLFAVAMLKVAMELKRDKAAGFERIFENTLAAMQVDRVSFRAYLERNLSTLKTTVKKRGY